ncbi:MAG TPA: hypothetical protein VJH23_02100 [archaeon]|nr:hypothetical protein [archaeon]
MARTKTKRVVALLLDPNYKPVSKYELAKKAGCTPSWALMLTKKLENKKFLKNLKVTDIKKLFELFHNLRAKKNESRSYSIYSLENTDKLMDLFKKANKEYAFTTYIAENIVQKYLFSHRSEAYIKKEDLEDWHKELTKLGTYGGGNVRIIVSSSEELFNKKQIGNNGPWIVSTPQLISDLYTEGGPAKEAGDMLLEKLIKDIEAKK